MFFDTLSLPSVLLLGLSTLILIISNDWRLSVSALGVMYVGIFVLLTHSVQLEIAVVKLVAGWISASILGISYTNISSNPPGTNQTPSEVVFRISASMLFFLVAFSLTSEIQKYIPDATFEQIFGGLILIGMGVLHIGFLYNPVGSVVGLLIFLAGYEVIFSSYDASILVTGLLAVVNMGLALVGAYLYLAPFLGDETHQEAEE